eukprot:COSAG06_NODE_1122_length_10628_cov_9.062684_8_plen_87_part_00
MIYQDRLGTNEQKQKLNSKRNGRFCWVGGRGWGSYRGQGLASQMEEHWSQQLEELASEHGERELEVLCDVHYALVLQRSGSAAVVP